MKPLWATALILIFLLMSCSSIEDPLKGTSWNMAQMGTESNLQEVSGSPPLTLEFLDGGHMKGSTGCNSYAGEYETRGEHLLAVDFMITEAGCPTQDLFWREHEYKSALPLADNFAIEDSRLVIGTEDGKHLVFHRQAE